MNEQSIMDMAEEIRQSEQVETPVDTPPPAPALVPPIDYDRLSQTIASTVATSVAAANRPPEVPMADQMAALDAKIKAASEEMDFSAVTVLQNQKFALMTSQMQAIQDAQIRALRQEVGTLKTKGIVSDLTRGREDVTGEVVNLLSRFGPDAASQIESNPDLKELVSLAVDGLASRKGVKTSPGTPTAQAISVADVLPWWADEGQVSALMSGFGLTRAEAVSRLKATEENNRNGY